MKAFLPTTAAVLVALPVMVFGQALVPSQDAYAVPSSSNNFGSSPTITVGGTSNAQGLVQFDLSQLPSSITASRVSKATLTLFVDHVSVPGTVNVSAAAAAWTESGVNGGNLPSAGTSVASNVSASNTNSFITVDATAAVQSWLTTPSSNYGFLIQGVSTTSVQFDSKENTNTSHPATLTFSLSQQGGLVWRDANGALVGPITGLSNASGIEVFYFDPENRAWPIDRETAQITTLAFGSTFGYGSVYYTGTNCTGTAYGSPVTPGFVYLLAGSTTYYLRPATLQSQLVTTIQSYGSGSGTASATCTNHAFTTGLTLVPLSGATPSPALTVPTVSFTGPLHMSVE
jgi:hypothetical protein